jgi:thiamine biosynthesis lipoprotein
MNSPCVSARARPLLGTLVDIRLGPGGDALAFELAFAAIERVQRLMSCHDPSSELSAVNRDAHRAAVPVDAWTFEVFEAALAMHRESGGVFDCAIGGRQVRAGRLPASGTAPLAPDATSKDIALLARNRVRFRSPLQVDLGGIAKGYAVDRAVEALREAGVAWGVVNAGGDLRVFGDRPQPVHVRLPDGALMVLGSISDAALASSTAQEDPPLGLPVLDGRGGRVRAAHMASVFAPSCMAADALTKAVTVLGDASAPLLARFGAEAVYCDASGNWKHLGRAH